MQIEFKWVECLEDIAKEATADIPEGETRISYMLAYELDAKKLISNPLEDVTRLAELWSSEEKPKELYFSHGEFRPGGLDHIVNELKGKPSSNRALYSLINQETISGSGDKPIPSFIVFQVVLDNETLYCSVYLRALEVSSFLRVNLEEIRLNLSEISNSGLTFNHVRLSIFSARAYHLRDFDPLQKPELDTLSPMRIFKLLSESPREMARMIEEKAKTRSIIEYESLQHILEYVEEKSGMKNALQLKSLLQDAIDQSKELINMRENQSHDSRVTDLSIELRKSLKKLAKAFE